MLENFGLKYNIMFYIYKFTCTDFFGVLKFNLHNVLVMVIDKTVIEDS
jgi:hypothetical protein